MVDLVLHQMKQHPPNRLRRRANAALSHCTNKVTPHQAAIAQNREPPPIGHHARAEKRWTSSFSIASARWYALMTSFASP